jgi:hypothetical protein
MSSRVVPTWLTAARAALSVAVCLSVVVVALTLRDHDTISITWDTSLWILFAVIAVASRLAISDYAFKAWKAHKATVKKRVASLPSRKTIDFAKSVIAERYNDETIVNLVLLLRDSPGFVSRIREEVTRIDVDFYEVTVKRTLRLDRPGTYLVPVLLQEKGELVQGLSIKVDEEPANTLSFLEGQGAVLAAAEVLAGSAFDDQTLEDLIEDILMHIAADDPTDPTVVIRSLEDAPLSSGQFADRYRDNLIELLAAAAKHHYLLCAVKVSSGDRILTVEVSARTPRTNSLDTPLDWVRAIFGLRSHRHYFPFAKAWDTVSYHFAASVPDGMYVYDGRFIAVDPTAEHSPVALSTQANDNRPHVPKALKGRSTSFVSCYLRDAANLEIDVDGTRRSAADVGLLVDIRERPPGLVEAVTLLSVYLVALTWVAGFHHESIFTGKPNSAAWSTVLFGIPTLISGWLVARVDRSGLARFGLPTVALSLWLVSNAAIGVFVAAFSSRGVSATSGSWTALGVTLHHPTWALLMLSTAVHSAAAFAIVASRYSLYLGRLTGTTRSA